MVRTRLAARLPTSGGNRNVISSVLLRADEPGEAAGRCPRPGTSPCGRQRCSAAPLPSGPGSCYFFPPLLFFDFFDFLDFFATRITPPPTPAGQRNVDLMTSTYH
jgi:hypothetical protein